MELPDDKLKDLTNRIIRLEDKVNTCLAFSYGSSQEYSNRASISDGICLSSSPLTRQEVRILNHIAHGKTNKEIAHLLGTSENTIKNQITTIFRRLSAKDRAHAVYIGMLCGWLSSKDEMKDMVVIS